MKPERWKSLIQKYRYALGVLLLGVLLLVIPGNRHDTVAEQKQGASSGIQNTQADEKRLQSFLEQIDGVGKTSVLLSYAASEEHTYVKDSGETVLVSAGSGKENHRINGPLWRIIPGL